MYNRLRVAKHTIGIRIAPPGVTIMAVKAEIIVFQWEKFQPSSETGQLRAVENGGITAVSCIIAVMTYLCKTLECR